MGVLAAIDFPSYEHAALPRALFSDGDSTGPKCSGVLSVSIHHTVLIAVFTVLLANTGKMLDKS